MKLWALSWLVWNIYLMQGRYFLFDVGFHLNDLEIWITGGKIARPCVCACRARDVYFGEDQYYSAIREVGGK
jgi:hypothetical protein